MALARLITQQTLEESSHMHRDTWPRGISLVIHVHEFICLWIYVKAKRRLEEDGEGLRRFSPLKARLSVQREVLMASLL